MTELSGQQQTPEKQSTASFVNVYIRLVSSKSFKVKIPAEETLENLKQTIQAFTGFEPSRQIIYYKGKDVSENSSVRLSDNTIIHVKQSEEIREEITINIYKHMPQERNHFKLNIEPESFKVNPAQLIGEFLKTTLLKEASSEVESSRTKIIECGRFLDVEKSFSEQKIQGQTDIHFILRSPTKELDMQKVEDERVLIASVLKHTRTSSLQKIQNNPEGTPERKEEKCQHGQKILNVDEDIFQGHKSDIYGEGTPLGSLEQMVGRKSLPVIPNYFNHTKSSGFWQSSKVIKDQAPPMKFNLREYKKYDGPRSVRDCNCQVKKEFYSVSQCEHRTSDYSPLRSTNNTNSLRHSAIYGHESRLKTKMTIG